MIGIIGAGMIGNTLAALCGMSNIPCACYVRSEEKAETARRGLADIFDNVQKRGLATDAQRDACMGLVSYVTTYEDLSACEIIFEAIAENVEVKRACYENIAHACPDVVAVGSCSSAIHPDTLSEAGGSIADKVLVTHPFFPCHMVPYVEVCASASTAQTAVDCAMDTLHKLHRKPVLLKKPNPGFIGNYLQFALWSAALKLVEGGVCDPADIDDCLRYSLGTRYSSIGIFEHFDNGGYKLNATTCDNVFPHLPRYDEAPAIVREKAESPDAWGAKSPTRRGFYDWSTVDMPAYHERVEKPWLAHIDWELPSSDEGLLAPIASDQPALSEALQISETTVNVGFEWDTIEDVWDKVREEESELREAYAAAPKTASGEVDVAIDAELAREVELEVGDSLFALVNIARRMGIDPEEALHATNAKFRDRWTKMEEAARKEGVAIDALDTEGLERLWQDAKSTERHAE